MAEPIERATALLSTLLHCKQQARALQACQRAGDDDCQPFEDTPDHPYGGVVSVGYAVTFVTLMPFGLLNLDENIGQQLASFWVLVATCVLYSASSSRAGSKRSACPRSATSLATCSASSFLTLRSA